METDNYIQMMTDSLEMKKETLTRIASLSEEQSSILDAQEFDGDAFQRNIDDKAELIERLVKLDEGFNGLFSRVKAVLDGHKQEYSKEIARIKELIKAVTELSVKVQAQEARNKTLAQSTFSRMKKEVENAKRSTKAVNTYYQNMNKLSYEPQLMDKKK